MVRHHRQRSDGFTEAHLVGDQNSSATVLLLVVLVLASSSSPNGKVVRISLERSKLGQNALELGSCARRCRTRRCRNVCHVACGAIVVETVAVACAPGSFLALGPRFGLVLLGPQGRLFMAPEAVQIVKGGSRRLGGASKTGLIIFLASGAFWRARHHGQHREGSYSSAQ